MATHNDFGAWAEDLVARYLQSKSYRILARNWTWGKNEIDIVALIDNTLVIVEVKARNHNPLQEPTQAVDRGKRKRLVLAADAYIQQHQIDWPVRFDIVAVRGTPDKYQIEHIDDAFIPTL